MVRKMSRRRFLVFLIAIILTTYSGFVVYMRFGDPDVRYALELGSSEIDIRWRYGDPDNDWDGYCQLGLSSGNDPVDSKPIRTLVFHPLTLLHPEGGTLWVWLRLEDGEWKCIRSCWFASGVRFY